MQDSDARATQTIQGAKNKFPVPRALETMDQKTSGKEHPVILIVEDNPVNQLLMRKRIEQAGYPYSLLAKNGQEAIALALKNNPDLILMDIQLPDMNGNEVMQSLRQKKYAGPIMAISADSAKEDMDRSFASGANGFVAKPIDFAVLISKINEFLPLAAGRENPRETQDNKNIAAGSRSRINPSVSAAARDIFITDAKEKLQIIAEALAHEDEESQMARIKAIAHEYKGNACYFGLGELERVAQELDRGFKNDERPEFLKKLTQQLVAVIEGILKDENA